MIGSVRDVSALKTAENALRDREALLTKVFQVVPDTLAIIRMSDGSFIDVNGNWEPLTGFTREEAIGRRSDALNLWSQPDQRNALFARVEREGRVHGADITLRHKAGHAINCRISVERFDAAKENYLLLSAQNITEEIATEQARQLAEVALRESEFKFSSIFNLSPVPLSLMRENDSTLIDVNDAWLAQYGFAKNEVIGATSLDLNIWCDLVNRQKLFNQLRQHKNVDQFECTQRHRLGHSLICMVSARLFHLGNASCFIVSSVNITRQREIEEEIWKMNLDLEERVRLRTLSLEHSNTELAQTFESLKRATEELVRSEKMAALGSLVAGIAHELNTPIGNSVTVASTLQEQTRQVQSDVNNGALKRSGLNRYLDDASTGTALLMRSLGNARELISSFKQVAVDQSSDQRRRFNLSQTIEEVVVTLAPMFKKTPYSLVLDLSPGIELDSYPGPLGQIITNLVGNALSHAFEGRATGTMRLRTRKLDGIQVEIIFSDDGIGIPEANQHRVFDPFFTTKLGQGGSGLGMNIVYNLVTTVLGGDIRLQSRIDDGTSMILHIPLSAPQHFAAVAGTA